MTDRLGVLLSTAMLALGTASFGTFAGSADLVRSDYHAQYIAAEHPQAIVEGSGTFTDAAVDEVRALATIVDAEPRSRMPMEIRVSHAAGWVPFELTVVPDLTTWRLGRAVVDVGTTKPRAGEILVDRSAVDILGVDLGGEVELRSADGTVTSHRVAGISREPGRATWFDGPAFGVTSREAVGSLAAGWNQLAIRTDDASWPRGLPFEDPTLLAIGSVLAGHGVELGPIEVVAPPGDTSLDETLDGIDMVLVTVGGLGLISSCLLVAGTVQGDLRRRRRQIGILQALGASTAQLTLLQGRATALRLLPGVAAGFVLGLLGARLLGGYVVGLINVSADTFLPSAPVLGVSIGLPAAVALAVALGVVWRAVGRPAVTNLGDRGLDSSGAAGIPLRVAERAFGPVLGRAGVRGLVRQGMPMLLATASLALGGALFLAVASVGAGLTAMEGVEVADVTGYRILATLMAGVGGTIVVTGVLGLFANLAAAAIDRRRELGVLSAIGASPRRVAAIVAVQGAGVALLAWGGAVLLWPLLAVPLGSELGTTLAGVGVGPVMGAEPLLVLGGFLAAGLAAGAIPALHAARTPPARALGYE